MNAWTAGELMARRMDGSQILVVPVVGAVLPSADHVKPLQTVQALRSGAQQLGLGNSLHQGGDPWFAIATYGARSAHPAGQLSLRHDGVPKGSPLAKKLEEAEQSNDLAEMAALCGRTDFALQIEASRLTSGDRVRHLLGVAIEAERKRPKLSLIETLLNATSAVHGGQMQDAQTTMSTHAFRDSRLLFEDGHLRSVGSTRTGGPAKLSIVDVPLAGHRELAVHLRLQSSQPLYVRVGIIDQDCGEPICESVTRLTLKDGYLARLPLPSIFGRAIVMLELSGADRIDILVDTLEIQ